MSFLSLLCHNKDRFLRRKGDHQAEQSRSGEEGKTLRRGIEIPPALCQLAERPR